VGLAICHPFYRKLKALVIADRPPSFSSLPSERVRYIPWSSQTEVTAVQQMDIGLMPLPNNEWTKGKCSFKMLQYMACAIPVIVSPVGMNLEVLELGEVGLSANSTSEWYDALVCLYKNRTLET
jgi:glycosyltransferase involved in cell wall biosynthesis